MATDFFLQIDGIDGESNDDKHKKWIDVVLYNYGTLRDEDVLSQPGTSRGVFRPFSFTHLVDKATPKLQYACMCGQSIKKAKLDVCSAVAGVQVPVFEVTLAGAKINKAQVKMEEIDGKMQLVERVDMLCQEMTWKATPIIGEAKGGSIETKFNQVENH